MKKVTKWLSIGLLLCLLVIFGVSCVACNANAKNLIYVIGDGMGFNHIQNTKLHLDGKKLAFEDYYVGEVTTNSANNAITDSAAAGTALATGTKTNNDYVGIDANGKELKNIMELSKRKGKKTGVVTTDDLLGATPAAFSAHAKSRDDSYDIIEDQMNGKVDLLMGKYNANYMLVEDDFVAEGFGYAETMDELNALSKKDKVLANIKNVDSTFDPNATNAVSLKTLVEYALEYLSTSERGFTLMVEGAYIDKHSHNRDLEKMIYALLDLNEAVEYILDWASKRTDTAVILTADHETGGLKPAENKDALSDALYTSRNHTASNVPLYLYNVTTELTTLDNVDVFNIAKKVVQNKL